MRRTLLLAVGGVGGIIVACATNKIDSNDDGGAPVVCKDAGGGQGEGCACDNKKYPRPCFEGPPSALKPGTACKSGTRDCVAGNQSACVGQVLPVPEVCNGIDDDCNGIVDDVKSDQPSILDLTDAGYSEAGTIQCFVNNKQGLCAAGRYGCTNNMPSCVSVLPERDPDSGAMGVADEICNGLDDDCNGIVDDVPWMNESCMLSGNKLGLCAIGAHVCVNANDTCKDLNVKPIPEICNNKDDDCNGKVDDGTNMCPAYQQCISGTCTYICPHVFAWDGSKYRYETSVGGASLVGRPEQVEKGRDIEFAPMWARLDSAKIDWSSGAGSARAKVLAAEDEIVYLDEARLTVFEHAPGYEIISSSSIDYKNWAGHPQDPRVFWAMRSAAMRAPLTASWMGSRDVTADLVKVDDHAAPFEMKQDNFYEIDFGPVGDASRVWLVLDGWKYKALRRLPADVKEQRPRVEVRGADGVWRNAYELAAPRGDRKTVAFDISGVAWPEGRYRMRVFTGTNEGGNATWYLDGARLTEEAPLTPQATTLDASVADLSFRGPPSILDASNKLHSLRSIDDGNGELNDDLRTFGRFTKYGDVRPLVAASDDRLVVMRRGDALDLRFDGIKRAAQGNELTLMLETDLLFKPRAWLEQKHGNALTENVEPMPYHGMGHYPPSAPRTDASYMHEWQTRVYTREDRRWGK